MKEIVVISGKGGTGKTVITGGLAGVVDRKIMADCDVDAANLHILLEPQIEEEGLFKSGYTAVIHPEKCSKCGHCIKVCRFDAIGSDYTIDPVYCEGCGFCSKVCPQEAISMNENRSGTWFVSNTRYGTLVHARLGIAEENSGKLVSLVKQKARKIAEQKNMEWIIVDGAPGIGCPVISSLSGADFALVVTEPTVSGRSDAERVINVAAHFGIEVKVVINKYDLNTDMAGQIEHYCREHSIQVAGRIGFDDTVVKAMVQKKTIMEHSSPEVQRSITEIWSKLKKG
ncbi:MAG: ATP-binding protein [Spirochaetota bacterium]